MVQGYNEQRYYRRDLRRTVRMTEPEIRAAYIRWQRSIEIVDQFLASSKIGYMDKFFPDGTSVSQVTACPLLLAEDRLEYGSARGWLARHDYCPMRPNASRQGVSRVSWLPSLHGVIAKGKDYLYFMELHRNATVNCLWQTHIRRNNTPRLFWRNEKERLQGFVDFSKNFYTKIGYYGPLRFRFRISNLAGVELKPSDRDDPLIAVLPDNTFKKDLIENSGKLLENPDCIVEALINHLFRAFGRWEAPN